MNHQDAAKNYTLRRYFPSDCLAGLIEQFWFVSWDLPEGQSHIQQNLPDPNFHFVINNDRIKVLGPIKRKYQFEMLGKGDIIGVKFNLGALAHLLSQEVEHYCDKEWKVEEIFPINPKHLLAKISKAKDDGSRVQMLERAFKESKTGMQSTTIAQLIELQTLIKSNADITSVANLSELAGMSTRKIQRLFQRNVGVSPKWLIRKYRLHQALALIENDKMNIVDIAGWLGYSDQSHLIRDFNDFIGVTPGVYVDT